MKKLFIIGLITCFNIFVLKSQTVEYCARMRADGGVVIKTGGKDLVSDMTLANGVIIRTDGTIIRKDNSQFVLKIGECVDVSGNITRSPDPKLNKRMDKTPPKL
jgi:hypothetical protein